MLVSLSPLGGETDFPSLADCGQRSPVRPRLPEMKHAQQPINSAH